MRVLPVSEDRNGNPERRANTRAPSLCDSHQGKKEGERVTLGSESFTRSSG